MLFAWLFQRWDYNLWVPFSLHALMNLTFQLFEVGETALAGWFPFALQAAVLVLAVLLTLWRRRIPLLRGGVEERR